MNITPAILFKLWQRAAEMAHWQSLASDVVRHRPCSHCTAQFVDAAQRIVTRADAWTATCEWADKKADPAVCEASDRLRSMQNWPYQFTIAELLAERETLGVTECWCKTHGSDAAPAERRAA